MADTDRADLAQAVGLGFSLIGSQLEGAGVLAKGEFSRQMALLALITRETAPDQADILDDWAAIAARIGQTRPS